MGCGSRSRSRSNSKCKGIHSLTVADRRSLRAASDRDWVSGDGTDKGHGGEGHGGAGGLHRCLLVVLEEVIRGRGSSCLEREMEAGLYSKMTCNSSIFCLRHEQTKLDRVEHDLKSRKPLAAPLVVTSLRDVTSEGPLPEPELEPLEDWLIINGPIFITVHNTLGQELDRYT
jgi:hypothetical protein